MSRRSTVEGFLNANSTDIAEDILENNMALPPIEVINPAFVLSDLAEDLDDSMSAVDLRARDHVRAIPEAMQFVKV